MRPLPLLLAVLTACTGGPPPAGATDTGCPEPGAPRAEVPLSFAPFTQWIGPDTVRLRFETSPEDVALPVLLDRGEGCPAPIDVTRMPADLTHYWPAPTNVVDLEHPDLPGVHVLHEATFEVGPGETVGWTVLAGGGARWEGTVRRPAADEAFEVVFVGDTMAPFSDDVFAMAASAPADLYLHGGDLQYQSNPIDTWSGLSHTWAALAAHAPVHPAVGNHELEDHDEFSQMYVRLLADAGQAVGPDQASVQVVGGVAFLAINSEATLTEPDDPQLAWLTDQLTALATDPEVREIVPYFHRPAWTLSKHEPQLALRALLTPLFADAGVRLVLQAHNHSYERFDVDGVTWIVDGGGGAFLYDVDDSVEAHPDDVPFRQVASQTFGATRLRWEPDGSVELVRKDIEGAVVDQLQLP